MIGRSVRQSRLQPGVAAAGLKDDVKFTIEEIIVYDRLMLLLMVLVTAAGGRGCGKLL
jgi:hypothetical protein